MTTKIFLQMTDLTDDPNTKFKYMNTPKVQMMNTPMKTVQIQLANLTDPNNKIKYQIQMTARFFLQMTNLTDDLNTKFK
jgi:hypothetical protein